MKTRNTTFNLELNNKPDSEGLQEVFLRMTQNRKHKRMKLGVSVREADFNKKARYGAWIRSSNPEYSKLNKSLEDNIVVAKEALRELQNKRQAFTLNNVKQSIVSPDSQDFYAFAKRQHQYFSTSTKYSYSFIKHFNSIIFNKLKTFTNEKGFNDLHFSDIDLAFLKDFESHLSQLGNKANTIHKNMGFIKALFNDAIEEKKIKPQDSPFLSYRIKKTTVNKDKLTREEIQKMEELILPENSLIWHSRNMFLFSFYQAGIRASDCIKLRWRNVIEGRLIYYMDKNDKPVNLKLMPKALAILKLYKKKDSKAEDFIFPLLDNGKDYSDRIHLFNQISSKNAQINENLRKIAPLAKIEKHLSFHIARHTFASLAKNEKGLSTDQISELLNHSSVSITKQYLRGFENSDMDKALESAQSKGTTKRIKK